MALPGPAATAPPVASAAACSQTQHSSFGAHAALRGRSRVDFAGSVDDAVRQWTTDLRHPSALSKMNTEVEQVKHVTNNPAQLKKKKNLSQYKPGS